MKYKFKHKQQQFLMQPKKDNIMQQSERQTRTNEHIHNERNKDYRIISESEEEGMSLLMYEL